MKDYFAEVKEFFDFQLNKPFEFRIKQCTPKQFRVIIILENKRYESDLIRFAANRSNPSYSVWAKMLSQIQGGF